MKRRPALLLELMIAFILMGGVVSIMMTGFFDAIRTKNAARKEKEIILTRHRLMLRFSNLFKKVKLIHKLGPNEYFVRCSGGVDPDPSFRQEIDVVVRVKENKLTLYSFPLKGPSRREILAENVQAIKLIYFDEEEGKFSEKFPVQKTNMVKIQINNETLPIFL